MKVQLLVGLLFVAVSLASARMAPLLQANNTEYIPGEYIVVLRSSLTDSELDGHLNDLAASFAADEDNMILHRYSIGSMMKGFAAKLSDEVLAMQRAHPDVLYVEVNQRVHAVFESCDSENTKEWNLQRISQRHLPLAGKEVYPSSAGAGVTIYVIDTGIYTENQDFEGRASWGFSAWGENDRTDGNGHGTHVASTSAGITYGVAKKATLVAVKVLDASGSGTISGVVAGIDWVTNNRKKPSVANMSLGGGFSSALNSAVTSSIAAGVTYAIAAGNSNENACKSSPASVKEGITVGATTKFDMRSSFSNWGECVHIFAPGSDITAAWIGRPTAINTISGTSMASPHVAGAAALVLGEEPSLTPNEVRSKLVEAATPNVISNPGTASPNLLLYTAAC